MDIFDSVSDKNSVLELRYDQNPYLFLYILNIFTDMVGSKWDDAEEIQEEFIHEYNLKSFMEIKKIIKYPSTNSE